MTQRVPTELKRMRGNPGHRSLPAVVIALPPIHPTTGPELTSELLRTYATAWIAESDRFLLGLVADAWDERARLMADISTNGYGDGRYTRTEVLRLRQVEENLTKWLSQLGLTPTDRSRLGIAEVKAVSKLEAIADRRAKRLGRPSGSRTSPPARLDTAKGTSSGTISRRSAG